MKKNFSKVKNVFRSVFKTVWNNLVIMFLILFVLDLVIGGLLFNAYCIQPKKPNSTTLPALGINRILLKKTADELAEKERAFEQAAGKTYLDPFRGVVQ